MSILAAPYVFAGTVSLILGYKTYNSYYNQQFEYLEIEDLQKENKEKPQEDDIIKEDDDEVLIPFPELITERPPSPSPPSPPPPSPSPPSPSPPSHPQSPTSTPPPQLPPTSPTNTPLPNIFIEDKLVKKNEITKLHKPIIVMETILEEKKTVQTNTLRRRKKRNRNRKN
jgi:hypothetical protein